MKKTPRKLVVNHETIRSLVSVELSRAVGGRDGSGAAACSETLVVAVEVALK
jgi:hypothetical protein